jgi:hypothetical protein
MLWNIMIMQLMCLRCVQCIYLYIVMVDGSYHLASSSSIPITFTYPCPVVDVQTLV